MTIADTRESLAFLNRGQSWVAHKFRDILPRIDNVPLRTEIFEISPGRTKAISISPSRR